MKKMFVTILILLASLPLLAKGEFEHLQWGLKNHGHQIQLKLTDIDRLTLAATKGEDINAGVPAEKSHRKIRIAVIDSGIDLTHPEFKNKIYRNEEECKAWEQYQACLAKHKENDEQTSACHSKWARTDTDGNGYPMDCQGWNVAAPVNALTGVQGNNDVQDLVGHGTHISGIIAAAQDAEGISGIINNVEILPVKVSGSTEEVEEDNTTDIFAKGILYALKQKVDIINLSVGWASSEDSLIVSELIKKAHELGVLVVVAGGNSAHSTETYPCAYNEVICVGSHNPDGSRSHFSNFGPSIDLFAPGHNILSTWPIELRPKLFTVRHGLEYKNGTSFSAPHVAGVLARLLNLGYSADQARVRVLGGARKTKANSNVINGHLDLGGALAFQPASFLYPYKKSAAFLNWHEGEKKVILKLKNYLQAASNVSVRLIPKIPGVSVKDNQQHFTRWEKDEVKDLTFFITGDESVPSEMSFELRLSSSDENKSYTVLAVATTVVHDKFVRKDTERFKVQTNRELEAFDFLPVENIHPSHTNDLLISQVIDGKLSVALLKQAGESYKLSRLHSTIFTKSLIIQAARVDLDLDGKAEYVLAGMYQNKDLKWAARFYIYDENFRPSDLSICPENELVNTITSMGTELRWMKKDQRMVPVWMAEGYAPSLDLPPASPWKPREINAVKKRIYYLDHKGLRSLNMPSAIWSDFSPIEFFNQSQAELQEGKIKFLYTVDLGFVKTFGLADTATVENLGNFELPTYQNLYPLDGLSHASTQKLIFSDTDLITGAGQLTVLDPATTSAEQLEYSYTDPLDPIQLVLNQTAKGNFFALTKYNLLYLDQQQVYKTESRNADHQIQYKRLKQQEALYLSSQHTPGLSSELVQFDAGKLTRPAKYRFLVGNGCQEIGYHHSIWEEQDQILFYCDSSKSILKVRL